MNFSRNAALWIFIVLLLFVLFNLFQGTANRGAADPLVFSDFAQHVEDGQVRDVTIQGQEITGHFNDGRSFETVAPDGINSNLVPTLEARGVQIKVALDDEVNPLLSILISWFPMLLLIGVWIFFMRQMQSGGGKAMGFGKS
ncbi:MAG: ATP-dependent metallopeptidase FtsH/Yme1/Tma family protein, partial [Rhodospirillales bacterium]|nr:ATP-dependent metallopeptidase FtsH/Yme1/Tma family protein [Rhodospirillales bacterium]